MVRSGEPEDGKTIHDKELGRGRRAPASEAHLRFAKLLHLYPEIGEPELDELAARFRKLPALDMALFMSDEQFAPLLNRFRQENRSKTRTPFSQYAVLVWMGVAVFCILAYAIAF